jgi:saccharopine dehydrogenase-like NADP-dependent oxidoreductase
MILIYDNAACHHKHEIGSLESKTKLKLIKLCVKYKVEYLDVPFNESRYQVLLQQEEEEGDDLLVLIVYKTW